MEYLVDCKSASGRGYTKFKYNNLSSDDPWWLHISDIMPMLKAMV